LPTILSVEIEFNEIQSASEGTLVSSPFCPVHKNKGSNASLRFSFVSNLPLLLLTFTYSTRTSSVPGPVPNPTPTLRVFRVKVRGPPGPPFPNLRSSFRLVSKATRPLLPRNRTTLNLSGTPFYRLSNGRPSFRVGSCVTLVVFLLVVPFVVYNQNQNPTPVPVGYPVFKPVFNFNLIYLNLTPPLTPRVTRNVIKLLFGSPTFFLTFFYGFTRLNPGVTRVYRGFNG
jgi:hypothetical protein